MDSRPGQRSLHIDLLRAERSRIECRWGRDFPRSSTPALGPTQPPIQWVPGLFPGGKAVEAWCWHPPASLWEVKGWTL